MIDEQMQGEQVPIDQNMPTGKMPQEQPEQTQQAPEEMVDEIASGIIDETQVEMGPAQEAQLDAYSDNATIAVYSEKSQPHILQMLQSGKNPSESIATAAYYVHKELEAGLRKTGEKPTEITLCMGAAHLVAELVALAEVAGLYETTNEERLEAFRLAIMKYFHEGLKIFGEKGANAPGAIDPVKLQQTVEPLMNDTQREIGNKHAQQKGLSKTAPPSGMMAMKTQVQRPQQQPQGILAGGMA